MSALTTEDLARPAADVPPSRRIKSPEELLADIAALDEAPYELSAAGKSQRHELQEELNEQTAVAAVDRQRILTALQGAEAVEQISAAAIECLTEYVRLRQEPLLARAPYDRAYVEARNAGIPCAPRVRIASDRRLMNEVTRLNAVPWYR